MFPVPRVVRLRIVPARIVRAAVRVRPRLVWRFGCGACLLRWAWS